MTTKIHNDFIFLFIFKENSPTCIDPAPSVTSEAAVNSPANNSTIVATVPPLPSTEETNYEVVADEVTESDVTQARSIIQQDSVAVIAPRIDQSHLTSESPLLTVQSEEVKTIVNKKSEYKIHIINYSLSAGFSR